MLNTHLTFEAKIPYGSKVVVFTRNYTKCLSFKEKYDLEGQGQADQFSNTSEIFRWSMNSLSVKAKFQIGKFKTNISKFVGQFDLEGQIQGHKFLK